MAAVGQRVLALALVAIAALVLAACGGGDDSGGGGSLSKEDYAQQLTDTVKPVGEKLQSIGQDVQASSSVEDASAKIDEAQQELEDVTAKVEALDPPEEVQAEHDTYVEKLKQLTTDVGGLKVALESKDQAKAAEAVQKLQQSGQEVTQAEQAISTKLNE
jgi:hypothetical protein